MKHRIAIVTGIVLVAVCQFALAANPAPAKARVLGYPPNQVQDLFQIQFTAIDGEDIVPRKRLNLDPGTYTLTARIPAEYTEAKVGQSKRKWTEDVDFELTLEEGHVYRVRGKWNRSDLETPYELVIEEVR